MPFGDDLAGQRLGFDPAERAERVRVARTQLAQAKWLRLCFVDLFGTLRSVHVPGYHVPRVLERGVVFDGSAIEGRIRLLEADRVLRPDLATVAALADGSFRVLGTVETAQGEPWPLDPRTALLCCGDQLGALAGRWRGAVELEWYLVTSDLDPVDRGGYFSEHVGIGPTVVHEAAEAIAALGIDLVAVHHEGGPGQYEVDLGEMGALDLADAITYTKAAIAEAASRHGIKATFVARPLAGQPGSGLHLHQRLQGTALVPEPTDESRWAIGGLLHHARGLCALAAPTVGSYRRLHSGPEAPGAIVWARTNRAALVRIGHLPSGEPSIEYRGADPSANPYLLLAGLLTAMSDGIDRQLAPGKPLEEEAAGFDLAAMEAAPQSLPRSLDTAIDALLEDEVLVDCFDARLLSRLVDGQRAEVEAAGANVTRADLLSSIES